MFVSAASHKKEASKSICAVMLLTRGTAGAFSPELDTFVEGTFCDHCPEALGTGSTGVSMSSCLRRIL